MTFAEAMAILGLCGIFLVFAEVFGWFDDTMMEDDEQ